MKKKKNELKILKLKLKTSNNEKLELK